MKQTNKIEKMTSPTLSLSARALTSTCSDVWTALGVGHGRLSALVQVACLHDVKRPLEQQTYAACLQCMAHKWSPCSPSIQSLCPSQCSPGRVFAHLLCSSGKSNDATAPHSHCKCSLCLQSQSLERLSH